jgi:hypothetical protein
MSALAAMIVVGVDIAAAIVTVHHPRASFSMRVALVVAAGLIVALGGCFVRCWSRKGVGCNEKRNEETWADKQVSKSPLRRVAI